MHIIGLIAMSAVIFFVWMFLFRYGILAIKILGWIIIAAFLYVTFMTGHLQHWLGFDQVSGTSLAAFAAFVAVALAFRFTKQGVRK